MKRISNKVEYYIENLFWEYDNLIKSKKVTSERDAFKMVIRKLLRKIRVKKKI